MSEAAQAMFDLRIIKKKGYTLPMRVQNRLLLKEKKRAVIQDSMLQYLTKVSTPLSFLQCFNYIFSWDNTEEMTL